MMKKHNLYILLLMCVGLIACSPNVPTESVRIRTCANCPRALATATAFAYADTGYVFSGRDSLGRRQSMLYLYDAGTDSWRVRTTPLKARVSAASAVAGEYAYIGLGYNGEHRDTVSYLRDWWQYDPRTNTWTELAPLPDLLTVSPVTWVLGDTIYLAHGFYDHYLRDVWRYSISANTWTKIPDPLGLHDYPDRTFGSVGATYRGRLFVGTGHYKTSSNQWSEYIPESHTWIRLSEVPGKGRVSATCTANSQGIYIMGGRHNGGTLTRGYICDDIVCYSPEQDSWKRCGQMPDGEAENRISFTIRDHVYFGLGENATQLNNHLYCIE